MVGKGAPLVADDVKTVELVKLAGLDSRLYKLYNGLKARK